LAPVSVRRVPAIWAAATWARSRGIVIHPASSASSGSVAAAAFAAFFAARTGGSLAGAGHLMATLEIIFAIGSALLALATVIGLRLPSGPVLQRSATERAAAEPSSAERSGV
jgi:hypothetical protein